VSIRGFLYVRFSFVLFAFFVPSASAKPMAQQVFTAIRFLRDLAALGFGCLIFC
jgi:hypothetical protein